MFVHQAGALTSLEEFHRACAEQNLNKIPSRFIQWSALFHRDIDYVIIFRYLSREILVTMFAVSSILLLITMSSRFARYLAEATTGKISVDILFSLIGFRLPGFLELIVPLGFFIAILLVYGRLYIESEMVVLSACGMSQRRLVGITMISAVIVAMLVAGFSLWLSPLGARQTELMLDEQRHRSEFDSLQEGRFQSLGRGQAMTYVESVSNNRRQLNHVFVAQVVGDMSQDSVAVIVAESGQQVVHPTYGQRYLVLHNGYRYEGLPGNNNYKVMRFSTYGAYLTPSDSSAAFTNKADTKTTGELLAAEDLESRVALQWRISMPILVLIVAILAVPLSRTNPRQGRYLKMLPAIFIYLLYLGALIGVRGLMDSGKWPLIPGLWLIHLVYLVLALLMVNWHNLQLWRQGRRVRAAEVSHA